MLYAIQIPGFSVLRVAGVIKRFVAGVPHRLMLWADGPSRNFTFGAVSVAFDKNLTLVNAAFMEMNIRVFQSIHLFASRTCNTMATRRQPRPK